MEGITFAPSQIGPIMRKTYMLVCREILGYRCCLQDVLSKYSAQMSMGVCKPSYVHVFIRKLKGTLPVEIHAPQISR